ncbi:hypothetical protein [Companilactobacillus pabuli]|uniref:hypothetical protein n=1 Tax=Companilactobacillus pabuli TaxID=2714036 RepID=UPI001EEA8906|nr:hypothetical protein [Companilactobacillus pabuli]
MAYHIVHDPENRAKHVLNTKKLYKWRITEQTKGPINWQCGVSPNLVCEAHISYDLCD